MRGNSHARFLEGGAAATPLSYSTLCNDTFGILCRPYAESPLLNLAYNSLAATDSLYPLPSILYPLALSASYTPWLCVTAFTSRGWGDLRIAFRLWQLNLGPQ